MSFRIGHGYDVHQLEDGLPLIIGGVNIPFSKGIVAHSDGDVLLHSIIDALLGATGLGDIGQLFPNDKKWENGSGMDMLKITLNHIYEKHSNFEIINIDSTLILQKPKMLDFKDLMKKNIAKILNINKDLISVKATTTDKLGFIGNSSGIAAEVVCLVKI